MTLYKRALHTKSCPNIYTQNCHSIPERKHLITVENFFSRNGIFLFAKMRPLNDRNEEKELLVNIICLFLGFTSAFLFKGFFLYLFLAQLWNKNDDEDLVDNG